MANPHKDGTPWHPFQAWAIITIVVVIIAVAACAAIAVFWLK